MSFSIDIRDVEELTDDPDDPVRDEVVRAYGGRPLTGARNGETFFQFSYDGLPPEAIARVIGDLGDGEPIGLLVEDLPPTDPKDPLAPVYFSVPKLGRQLQVRYSGVATISLDDAYRMWESRQIDDEQMFAAVLMDLGRNPIPGFPVVVFGW